MSQRYIALLRIFLCTYLTKNPPKLSGGNAGKNPRIGKFWQVIVEVASHRFKEILQFIYFI